MKKALWLIIIGGIAATIYGIVEVLRRVSLLDLAVWGFILGTVTILSIATIVIVKNKSRSAG